MLDILIALVYTIIVKERYSQGTYEVANSMREGYKSIEKNKKTHLTKSPKGDTI